MLESILMIEKNVLPLFKLKFFLNQVVNLHIVIIWIFASMNPL